MKKHCILDNRGTDMFFEICDNREDALTKASKEWEHLTKYDRKKRINYCVVLCEIMEDETTNDVSLVFDCGGELNIEVIKEFQTQ